MRWIVIFRIEKLGEPGSEELDACAIQFKTSLKEEENL
jgi:hypothetical protein